MRLPKPPYIDGYICMGVLTGAHGLLGDVIFKPFVEDIDVLQHKAAQIITNQQQNITLQRLKRVGGSKIALKVAEIDNRNQAEEAVGTFLYVQKEILEDTIVEAEIVGLPVFLNGQKVGDVHNVFDNGAQLVLEITQDTENKDFLVPVVDQFVAQITDTEVTLTADAEMFLSI